ncbi:MAG: GNAT family N-acetyltransferase [Romboutsia sp.]|uniref:GNAT family N-acetyltransferase n=1 Tax=Romboutsia sp. TaxID=1965302 RepID=UPI003F2BFED2
MIYIRAVEQKDCELLFTWSNEKYVRKNSFNLSSIDLNEHKKWFSEKINDENCKMFIITKDNKDVGQIRIDIDNQIGTINYSIDFNYRGQGIGSEVLKIINIYTDSLTLIGKVKKENKASIKAFENAGYKKFDKDEYIEFIQERMYKFEK